MIACANLSFALARWFGRKSVETHLSETVLPWDEKLKQNGIVAVNFSCGLTAIRQRDYAIGTFIGIFPSLVGFVLLGGVAAAGVEDRVTVLVLSICFMLLGFGIAHVLKRRERALTVDE